MDNSSGSSDGKNSSRLANMVLLRLIVSGYLAYLGASLIYEQLRGTGTLQPWLAWAMGAVFTLGGLCFGLYSWKQYRVARRGSGAEEADAEDPKD